MNWPSVPGTLSKPMATVMETITTNAYSSPPTKLDKSKPELRKTYPISLWSKFLSTVRSTIRFTTLPTN